MKKIKLKKPLMDGQNIWNWIGRINIFQADECCEQRKWIRLTMLCDENHWWVHTCMSISPCISHNTRYFIYFQQLSTIWKFHISVTAPKLILVFSKLNAYTYHLVEFLKINKNEGKVFNTKWVIRGYWLHKGSDGCLSK